MGENGKAVQPAPAAVQLPHSHPLFHHPRRLHSLLQLLCQIISATSAPYAADIADDGVGDGGCDGDGEDWYMKMIPVSKFVMIQD